MINIGVEKMIEIHKLKTPLDERKGQEQRRCQLQGSGAAFHNLQRPQRLKREMLDRSPKRTETPASLSKQIKTHRLSVLVTELFSLRLNEWYQVNGAIPVPPTVTARKGWGSSELTLLLHFHSIT